MGPPDLSNGVALTQRRKKRVAYLVQMTTKFLTQTNEVEKADGGKKNKYIGSTGGLWTFKSARCE